MQGNVISYVGFYSKLRGIVAPCFGPWKCTGGSNSVHILTQFFLLLLLALQGLSENACSAPLYQMEVGCFRYPLSKYLRTRLGKVERNVLRVLAAAEGEMQGRSSHSCD